MTPQALQKVEDYFGPYAGQEDFKPALELIEHTKELRAFVLVLTDYLAMPGPTPEKIAEHYQMVRRANELRNKIQPVK
jgi:dihydrodipicolinate synthase/N-acetylneuraminate lyase